MRYWLRNRLACFQLAVACLFATACALTNPGELSVPAIFGSIGAFMVFNNLFGLVLAIVSAVALVAGVVIGIPMARRTEERISTR